MFTPRRWLCLAAVAACAVTPVRAAELNRYLPEDAEIVVVVNVSSVMESGLVQKHIPALLKQFGGDLVKLMEAEGAKLEDDFRKELVKTLGDAEAVRKWINDNKGFFRRIVIATTADVNDGNAFLIFEGDFSKDKTKEFFDVLIKNKPLGIVARTVKEGKHEFYGLKVPGDEDEMFVALADDKNIVCSQDKAVLAKALGRKGAEKPVVKKELIDLANPIDEKVSLWMAAAPKEMDEYVTAHAVVLLTDGIKVVASVTSKDADGARNMASDLKETFKDAVEDLNDAAKLLPPLGALRDILKKIEPKAEKNVVRVEVEVPGATIDKLVKDLAGSK